MRSVFIKEIETITWSSDFFNAVTSWFWKDLFLSYVFVNKKNTSYYFVSVICKKYAHQFLLCFQNFQWGAPGGTQPLSRGACTPQAPPLAMPLIQKATYDKLWDLQHQMWRFSFIKKCHPSGSKQTMLSTELLRFNLESRNLFFH